MPMAGDGDQPADPAFAAVVFDMDGVVTRTAALHAAAWKTLFDEFLLRRAQREGVAFVPFDPGTDYRVYVDGKPREEGVRSFLRARELSVPEGEAGDPPEAETVRGLAARKDAAFEAELRGHGVELFESTVALIEGLRAQGVKTGLVTSSRHGRDILARAGIEGLFDARIDGIDVMQRNLQGKPHPDAFLACAGDLGLTPVRCVVVEDATSGVAAARAGGFGLVIGVDRGGNRHALEQQGADLVVDDPGALTVASLDAAFLTVRCERTWRIEQEGFDPARERDVESLFAIGNGYLGVRAALDTPLTVSQGDLFIAGIYDRKQGELPYSEHEFLNPDSEEHPYSEIVSFPFPFRLRLSVDGRTLSLADSRWLSHARALHMRTGLLTARGRYEVAPGRFVTVESRRCASLDNMHLLLQEVTVLLENHSAAVELDASLHDPDLARRHPHVVPVSHSQDSGAEVWEFATRRSGYQVCVAQRAVFSGAPWGGSAWRLNGGIGEKLVFHRWVAVYTSRDGAKPRAAAVEALSAAPRRELETALAAHGQRWEQVWARTDVQVEGSPAAEQALRFNGYQLSSAADHDPRVSVGARALTGRAYEGHIFWDVEVFMLPFYLHSRPEVARNLLAYRHHTLPGAKRRAAELGYGGACYAWESTVTGEDVTPRKIVLRTTGKEIPIFTGTQQIHVTADVAFGVWRYWEATGDERFLASPGAEILAETARFWASRVVAGNGRYHIRGVVGPDEYHHDVNDNAYTNWMARYNLELAVRVCEWLEQRSPRALGDLEERLGIDRHERGQWHDVARHLYVPQPDERGIIEQFEGFFDLEEYALPPSERFRAPIERLFDWDRINGLKLLKQADVLMLPFLFPQEFDRDVLAANYHYYEPRTDHGSSLSPGVHAALAARLGLEDQAERYFQQSLTLDLSNVMGNSTLGVHPACMGATWQALVFHFLGVRFDGDEVGVAADAAARLPRAWQAVELTLQWRGRTHTVEVRR